jgi:putative DNA methylase
LIDDPGEADAPEELLQQIDALPRPLDAGPQWHDLSLVEQRRRRLFGFIEKLVQWENSNNEAVLETARALIHAATGGNPPPVYDPFCGGGSIPLEAQRLGLEAHSSDLNPVAVLITKALIEIPPKFANQPPVNPESLRNSRMNSWTGAQGLAEDVRYYGQWMREEAFKRIGHLYPKVALTPRPPLPEGEGEEDRQESQRWEISAATRIKMQEVARQLRREATPSEVVLWEALRNRKLEGRKFRRQHPIGTFVVDFFCKEESLIVEVDGPVHATQHDLDCRRQELIESLGLRFVRLSSHLVENNLPEALAQIRAAFHPHSLPSSPSSSIPHSPSVPPSPSGRGAGGEGSLTVIAWLWARTVKCPNPGCGAQMPLVRSFALSTKKGKETWVEPVIDPSQQPPVVRFEVRGGAGTPPEGTVNRRGARCICCGNPVLFDYIRAEGKAGRMSAEMLAIVAEGQRTRIYLEPSAIQQETAENAKGGWFSEGEISHWPGRTNVVEYGMRTWGSLFTPRQLVALTTFSDLVSEARERVIADAKAAGLSANEPGINDGGSGAAAYGDAVATFLSLAISKLSDSQNSLVSWKPSMDQAIHLFTRQAIPMIWDYAEPNVFSEGMGDFIVTVKNMMRVLDNRQTLMPARVSQVSATELSPIKAYLFSTDPPYYDNIGYADLSDFFYVWLRRSIGSIYPDICGTLLVPKSQELVATPYRFDGNRARAQKFFEEGLERSFSRMRQAHLPDYPMTVYYAFKQSEADDNEDDSSNGAIASTGWETMLEGLLHSGFQVTGTWPMRTELSNRPVASGTNALASSIVLVCRPRPETASVVPRREFLAALRRELPGALRQLQQGNIAPVDLQQSAIGPGMAVYSRYSKVLEADGTPMRVRTALTLINQILDEVLSEQEGDFDPDTRWALSWYDQHGFNEGLYGDAETLATARNIAVSGLAEAGILEAKAGKVRLLRREELPEDWEPTTDNRFTIWEATQHLIRSYEQGGEAGAASLVTKLGSDADTAKELAYRLYALCDRRGRSQEASPYNALVISWPRILELVAAASVGGSEQTELM